MLGSNRTRAVACQNEELGFTTHPVCARSRSMDPDELKRIERKARFVYEWSRAQRALLGFGPALRLVVIAALLGRNARWPQ